MKETSDEKKNQLIDESVTHWKQDILLPLAMGETVSDTMLSASKCSLCKHFEGDCNKCLLPAIGSRGSCIREFGIFFRIRTVENAKVMIDSMIACKIPKAPKQAFFIYRFKDFGWSGEVPEGSGIIITKEEAEIDNPEDFDTTDFITAYFDDGNILGGKDKYIYSHKLTPVKLIVVEKKESKE